MKIPDWKVRIATKKTPLVLFEGKKFLQVSKKLTKAEQKKLKVRPDENTNDWEHAWDFGGIKSWFYQKRK